MKIQIVGLGQFGMFLAEHFTQAGCEVCGIDLDSTKRVHLEKLGGVWGDHPSDVRLLAVFPWQVECIPNDGSLVVNLSSVQQPGVERLNELGLEGSRQMSIHPLFGPVGVSQKGWIGKQVIVTKHPGTPEANELLKTFESKGVLIERMTPELHDEKMLSHALAFLISEIIKAGGSGCDPKYFTGSASHMFGLLEFTDKSEDLRKHILSNPALKARWPAISWEIQKLVKEFGVK